MRPKLPSPAMVVACIALFVALGGTSIAAVSFARNAGKVDGKDAFRASVSLRRAAGDLVATNRSGPHAGRIPSRFLAETPRSDTFGRYLEVQDNALGAPMVLAARRGFSTITAACSDEAPAAGIENASMVITVSNESGGPVNLARRQGAEGPAVVEFANGTVQSFTVVGANAIEVLLQKPDGTALLIDAGARQVGQGSPAAGCNIFGVALNVRP